MRPILSRKGIASFAAALTLFACSITPDVARDALEPATHTVTIDASRFHPEALTIRTGDSVVWINKDLIPHTATSDAGGFDSRRIDTEKSWTYTAAKKGDFPYVCTFHPTMKARLQVE